MKPGAIARTIANNSPIIRILLQDRRNVLVAIDSLHLENQISLAKYGGALYAAVPGKRYTFDMYRPAATYGHLLKENVTNPSRKFYKEHADETVRLTEQLKAVTKRVNELVKMNYSIHYPIWTQQDLYESCHTTTKSLHSMLRLKPWQIMDTTRFLFLERFTLLLKKTRLQELKSVILIKSRSTYT